MALVVVAVLAATTLGLVMAALTAPVENESPASSAEPVATAASASYSGLLGPFDVITFSPPAPREVYSNSYEVGTSASGTSGLEIRWRLIAVAGNPCPGTSKVPDSLDISFRPSPLEAYEIIRKAPALLVSDEHPYTLAGVAGRYVDIRVDPEERDQCWGPVEGFELDYVGLTSGARGSAGGARIVVPFDGVLRLGIVEVAGYDVLVTASAWTEPEEELERAWAMVDSIDVSLRDPSSFDFDAWSQQGVCQDLGSLSALFAYRYDFEDPATWDWDRTMEEIAYVDRACGYPVRSLMRAMVGATPSP
jgi:hypothetical protein